MKQLHLSKWCFAACFILCTLALICVLPLSAHAETADFSVSQAFSSNMVIQRDEPIRVWGWADESRNGETVTATFAGKTAEGTVKDGEWTVTFEEGFAASAATGNDMTVTCGADKTVFEDVLVGDVYMVIGQSNVAYSMQTHCATHGVSLGSVSGKDKPIRLYYNTLNDTAGYPRRGTEEVCEDVVNGRGWWLPTASNVSPFTALGYLFALEIVERTDGSIPVGIIEIDGNGQPIGAFMPNEAAGATDSDSYSGGFFAPPGVNGTYARYMYNHYMYPYENYALAGVIWYQGESDYAANTAETYVNKFVALMEHMRSTHNLKNTDFPVYIVEIPTIYNKPAGFTGTWHTMDLGYIRAEMGSIPTRLPNSYMAVSSDIFTDDQHANSLHPDIKDAQAERLADIAGSVWYGLTPLDEATGPILRDYEASDDRKTVILTFDNVGDGLTTSDGGTTVRGFVSFTKIGKLGSVSLTATITAPNQITVTADSAIYGVAYNCVMDNLYGDDINLCNSFGKIASAFTYSEMQMYRVRREIVGDDATLLTPVDGESPTFAIHFYATGKLSAVGTQVRTPTGTESAITLSLYAFDTDYATTLAGTPIKTKTCTSPDDFGWAELTANRTETWEAGEYLLVLSDMSGISLSVGGAHEGQVCYLNGAYSEGTSVLLGVSYTQKVAAAYGIPTDPNTETEPETEPETPPETLPEEPSSPSTEPVADPETEAETEATTETEPETVPETATATDSESDATETADSDDAGCTSTLGGLACAVLWLAGSAILLSRRRQSRI